MTPPSDRPRSLREALTATAAQAGAETAALHALGRTVPLTRAVEDTWLADAEQLRGRCVLLRTADQLSAALALIALDGHASRIVLCPPDVRDEDIAGVVDRAHAEAIVSGSGRELSWWSLADLTVPAPAQREPTEWVMFTSGTTGAPKMVVHSLDGLTGAIAPGRPEANTVWGTFYDVRRYGGLQILLRALFGGCSLVLSDAHERMEDFLVRLGEAGVTHLTGTPSHWRRALMSPQVAAISPLYVRLSGEIADQDVLDGLAAAFPNAAIGHAYASTEAGVGFEVRDGLEGFPAEWTARDDLPVRIRVVDGALQLSSPRAASGYVGGDALAGDDGFVDTGDLMELRDGRYRFSGRRGGIINVGGLKVHPEEVEAVINASPAVRLSRVSGRRNPITGMIVVAEVVLDDADRPLDSVKDDILQRCRSRLAPFKTPAAIKVVSSLPLTAAGKLERAVA